MSQFYTKQRVSARGIVFHDGCMLLNRFGDGVYYYNTPGGGVEENETAAEAAVREVWEETGLRVAVKELVFIHEFQPRLADSEPHNHHSYSFMFRCDIIGEPTPLAAVIPDVCDCCAASEPVWVPIEQLATIDLMPRVGQQLIDYYHTGVFTPLYHLMEELP